MSPRRPRRPCARPGCPELITTGSYCAKHRRQRQRERRKDPEQAAFYRSTFWTNLSKRVKVEEPTCRECLKVSRTSPTAFTDHIDNDWRNCERSNLQGLCADCHATKSAREHGAKSRGAVTKSDNVGEPVRGREPRFW